MQSVLDKYCRPMYGLMHGPTSSQISNRDQCIHCGKDSSGLQDGMLGVDWESKSLGLRHDGLVESFQEEDDQQTSSPSDIRAYLWTNSRWNCFRSLMLKQMLRKSRSSRGSNARREYSTWTRESYMASSKNSLQVWASQEAAKREKVDMPSMRARSHTARTGTQGRTGRSRHRLSPEVSYSLRQRPRVHSREYLPDTDRASSLQEVSCKQRAEAS